MLDIIVEHKLPLTGAPGILQPLLLNLFLPEILNKEPNEFESPINPFCVANQGVLGAIDYHGNVSYCYSEFSDIIGTYYPQYIVDEKRIAKWNSPEFIIDEFKKEPCIDCKYFFMCNRRSCPLGKFHYYNKEKYYCEDFYYTVVAFVNYMGKKVWNNG